MLRLGSDLGAEDLRALFLAFCLRVIIVHGFSLRPAFPRNGKWEGDINPDLADEIESEACDLTLEQGRKVNRHTGLCQSFSHLPGLPSTKLS